MLLRKICTTIILVVLNIAHVAGVDNNIQTRTLRVGEDCSVTPSTGDQVVVHYNCKLVDGTVLRSTYDNGDRQPDVFTLGEFEVISGLEYGLTAMCLGEKRYVEVPPIFAFGAKGKPPSIPPNSTLYFEVELLEVRKSVTGYLLSRRFWMIVYISAAVLACILVLCKVLPNLPSQKKKACVFNLLLMNSHPLYNNTAFHHHVESKVAVKIRIRDLNINVYNFGADFLNRRLRLKSSFLRW